MIRRGRSEAWDKLFTYVVLAAIAVGVVFFFIYLHKTQLATVGGTAEIVLLEDRADVRPGGALRWSLNFEPRGRSVLRYYVEVVPDQGSVFFGVVHPGRTLEPGNVVWFQAGTGIQSARSGRRTIVREKIDPGKYDIVVENRGDTQATAKIVVKALYDQPR